MSARSFSANEMMTIVAARALGNRATCASSASARPRRLQSCPTDARARHHPDLRIRDHRRPADGAAAVDRRWRTVRDRADHGVGAGDVPLLAARRAHHGRLPGRRADGPLRQPQHHRRRAATRPKVRLPGGGGAPEIASSCQEIFITMPHVARAPSSSSCRSSPPSVMAPARGPAQAPRACDQGPDRGHDRPVRAGAGPGNPRAGGHVACTPALPQEAARAACGWPLRFSDRLATTAAPSEQELQVLRDLQARTAAAPSG